MGRNKTTTESMLPVRWGVSSFNPGVDLLTFFFFFFFVIDRTSRKDTSFNVKVLPLCIFPLKFLGIDSVQVPDIKYVAAQKVDINMSLSDTGRWW